MRRNAIRSRREAGEISMALNQRSLPQSREASILLFPVYFEIYFSFPFRKSVIMLVNSMGKIYFVDGLVPKFLSVSKY